MVACGVSSTELWLACLAPVEHLNSWTGTELHRRWSCKLQTRETCLIFCVTVSSMLQGVYCGEQPYKVIAMCILAIGVCCLGLLRFQVETNPQRLWVGSASLAAREKAQYEVIPIPFHQHATAWCTAHSHDANR